MNRSVISKLVAVALVMLALGGSAWGAPAASNSIFLPLVSQTGPSGGAFTSTYNVGYTDGTAVIDAATVQSGLLSISDDQAILRFKPGVEAVKALKAGQVALFAGSALRRVESVQVAGDAITVTTSPATLNEAVKNGQIAYAYRSSWANLPASTFLNAFSGEGAPPMRVVSASGFGENGAISPAAEVVFTGQIQGWDVEFRLSPAADRLNISLVASRSFNGAKIAAVSGKGSISNFSQETFLTYDQSTPTQITAKTTGLQGDMELKWSAFFKEGGAPTTQLAAFQIPATLPIPFTVGPIPMVLKIKAVLQVVPELRFQQSSSGGSFKVSFNSDQGFSVNNTLENPFGQLNSGDIGLSGETVSASLIGAAGFGFGVEFPRFELTVLGTATAFITVKTYSYSIFTLEPPCQKGGTDMFAAAGYNLKVLGSTIADGKQELWKKSFLKFKDDKPC